MTNDKVIELTKEYSKLINKSKRQVKECECLWCGKKITHFCNLHPVPRSVLKNIDMDGDLDYFNFSLDLPFTNKDQGIDEPAKFRLLCDDCDKSVFQDYEDLKKLETEPTEKMLEEIVLKNILVILNKRFIETELFENLESDYKLPYLIASQEVDLLIDRDIWWEFFRVKEMLKFPEKAKSKYKMFFWRTLDYVIPIAFQGAVTLYGDLEGNMVIDAFNMSEDVIIKRMHICMFPLETSSVVFAFYHAEDTEYDNFAEQFCKLDEEEQLAVLSYIVYRYSDDIIFAKKFPHRTWFINKVSELFMEINDILAFDDEYAKYQMKLKLEQLKNRDRDFPCILSKKFAVRKE